MRSSRAAKPAATPAATPGGTPTATSPEADPSARRCTVFDGHRRLASGALLDGARAIARALAHGSEGPLLVFDDDTGSVIDIDIRGTEDEVAARYAPRVPEARRPGRPKLGVVAREVTLLPRHWDWLAAQPGGASVAIRRLVEEAHRRGATAERARRAREAAYRVMHALAGDLPRFEDASRALFAGDRARLRTLTARWPRDVRTHIDTLAFGGADDAP